MQDLRKTLASAFIATALLGGTVATPAFAGGDDKDSKSHSKHDKKYFYCEDDKEWYTWGEYKKECEDYKAKYEAKDKKGEDKKGEDKKGDRYASYKDGHK